ncbi:hypothetical protein [Lacticaseibacillus manihotivorans]|uniref:Uncharacterized protein n=2 Tax=Lacticaseibacillus manihotivorans TaxID=88233 RepID=A0A0R1QIW8_9LACO|nr:hypothetical protein [Lacticaseibacillus manihotivorans]KRL44733.1 hypothetical protein FD01_GL001004 [Lacticaseibacillus manihotivorans DSM 13343 = JCM 12514]QFQ92721.1 hypothetical protein LM010_15565 [Lacticaseibacillus manihotivorans]
METTIKQKASGYLHELARFLHLDQRRLFYGVVAVLMLLPVAFLAFLAVNATMESMSIIAVLKAKPLIAALSIIAGLDMLVGYTLWMARQDILADRTTFRWVISAVVLSQLFVSNVLVAIAGTFALAFSGKQTVQHVKANVKVKLISAGLLGVYGLCLWLVMTLAQR